MNASVTKETLFRRDLAYHSGVDVGVIIRIDVGDVVTNDDSLLLLWLLWCRPIMDLLPPPPALALLRQGGVGRGDSRKGSMGSDDAREITGDSTEYGCSSSCCCCCISGRSFHCIVIPLLVAAVAVVVVVVAFGGTTTLIFSEKEIVCVCIKSFQGTTTTTAKEGQGGRCVRLNVGTVFMTFVHAL